MTIECHFSVTVAKRTYLFVIDSLSTGGTERSLLELLPRLDARGVNGTVVCLHRIDSGFEQEAVESGIAVEFLEGHSLLGKLRSLRRLVSRVRPALVYTSLFEADLVGRLATVGFHIPVVVGLVNTAYDEARYADPNIVARKLLVVQMIDRLLARFRTDHFHAVSEAVKSSTIASLGVPADRITVARRGRDPVRMGERTQERRAASRRRLELPADAEVVVTVGRQEYQKGHVHLIEAFPTVLATRPQARLVIAGRSGSASPQIMERISSLDLKGLVSVLGHRSDVLDVMAASDLFVFPSLYEGAGGALIEALALGLPAVVSDIPSLREVALKGENADLVPPRDSVALAQSIASLLEDRDRLERYGKRSREIFDAYFHADQAADQLLELLDSIAGPANTP